MSADGGRGPAPNPSSGRPRAAVGGPTLQGLMTVTVVFVVATVGAVIRPGPVRLVSVVLDLLLFAGGSLLFLAAFAVAIARSRNEQVSLGGTFLLSGTAPSAVRRRFLGLLALQVVVGVGGASLRPYSSMAFAVLAPMSAFGAMAWWGARYGVPMKDDTTRPD